MSNQVAVIGLAVMGANLARNFASRGLRTAVYNRTYSRTEELLRAHPDKLLTGYRELSDLVASLEKPRRIILMVQAGEAVDDVLRQLYPLLTSGDYLVDGGNSHFEDSERRSREAAANGLKFFGMGISGGEEGALKGPSLMPGISTDDWQDWQEILEKIAARDFTGNPCVTPIGRGGAGHFVKMVHNGIEYAIMQAIAEIYDYNRKVGGLSAEAIAAIFEKLSSGRASSYLTEITAAVLRERDPQSGQPLVDLIVDRAAQKGTGGWTSIESVRCGAAAEMIGEAVASRSISSYKLLRNQIAAVWPPASIPTAGTSNPDWDNVLSAAMTIAYAQGLFLIRLASENNQWQTDPSEILRIWQGGCIIRSRLLVELRQAWLENPSLEHLFLDRKLSDSLAKATPQLLDFIDGAMRAGVAVPACSSACNYLLQFRSTNSPANLLQAMRDFFGAHTFERTDREGIFHHNWSHTIE
jgi:6-phosphogluconate dehydrogenase